MATRVVNSTYMIIWVILQVHVSERSTMADHCRIFALSDPNEKKFQEECNHGHEDACDRCDQLVSTIDEIESALAKVITCYLVSMKCLHSL